MIAEMPYADLNSALDDPPGYRNYWSAEHLDSFPDPAVDAFCARASDMVVPSASQHVLFPMGGAGSLVRPTIRSWRRSNWVVHLFGCGPTRPTTSGQSAGPATCALTCIRGRPARSTSTSLETKAPSESSPGWGRTTRPTGHDQGRVRPGQRVPSQHNVVPIQPLAGRGEQRVPRPVCVRGQFTALPGRPASVGAGCGRLGRPGLRCPSAGETPQSKHGVHRQSSTSISQSVLPVLPEPVAVQPSVQVIPGQDFGVPLAGRVPVEVDDVGGQCRRRRGDPAVIGEVLAPPVEAAAVLQAARTTRPTRRSPRESSPSIWLGLPS